MERAAPPLSASAQSITRALDRASGSGVLVSHASLARLAEAAARVDLRPRGEPTGKLASPPAVELPVRSHTFDRKLARAFAGFATLIMLLAATLYAVSGSAGLVLGVFGFYMIVGSLYLLGAWGSTRWLARVCSGAALAIEAGRLDEARVLLDLNLERAAANTPMYAVAIWLRCRLAVLDGEFDRAFSRLETLLGWHWYAPGGVLHAHVDHVRATAMLALVLAGEVERAQRWREQAQRRGELPVGEGRPRDHELELQARRAAAALRTRERTWLLADVALLARSEQFSGLLDFLGQRSDLAATLPKRERQSLAVLQAWALFRARQDEHEFRGVHGGDDSREPLRREQVELGQVAYLGHAWPELREFMLGAL